MKHARILPSGCRRGSTLVLSLFFIAIFSALAVGMAVFSGANAQIANNLRKLNHTRACAESGLEVMRYWLGQVAFSGTTPPSQRFATLAASLQNALNTAGVTNVVPVCTSSTITLSNVPLDSARHESFSALLTKIDDDNIQMDVTGRNGNLHRSIRSNLVFDHRANNVFDYGVATKGPLQLSGNIDLTGANIDVESNAYIETDELLALEIIGNSHIAGTVKLTNSLANVNLQGGQAGIGGVTGPEATQPPHTLYGCPTTEFPEMVPSRLEKYVTHTLDPATNTSSSLVLDNVRIPAGMNPKFTGGVTIRGVIYIEAPNVVMFGGSTAVTGVIVGNGSPTDYSGTNQITFTGNLTSLPVSTLPQEPQFEGIRNEVGTFLMAPGFAADFEGPFTTVSGAIAANGITFGGSAGGTIYGSLINYSPNVMDCGGRNDLYFNRSGLSEVPAGFVPETVLYYDPASYKEVLL
jgi:Tfp pilus assembly protein PilX